MEIKDWITLGSAVLLIIGWFVNSWLNRRHEIAKKCLEYRLTMLNSYFQISSEVFLGLSKGYDPFTQNSDFANNLHKVQMDFLLYGYRDEMEQFSIFINSLTKKSQDLPNDFEKLNRLVRENLRQELGLSKK